MQNTQEIYEKMFEEASEAYAHQKEIVSKYKDELSFNIYVQHNSMLNDVGKQMAGIINYLSPKKESTQYVNSLLSWQKAINHCFSCEYFHKDIDKTYGVCHNEKMSILHTGYISNENYKFDNKDHKWQKRHPDQICCKHYLKKKEDAV